MTFLGTGGGRFVLLNQRRYSGGLWLDLDAKILVDPGPGSLVRALQFKKRPQELDAVLVSHNHLDHYNDAEVMIEAMTYGTKKRNGSLVISENALGYISEYHRQAVDVLTPKPGDEFRIKELPIKALPTYEHEGGIGFRFQAPEGDISYSADTGYSESLAENYKGSRILILNVIFPSSKKIASHLNTEDAIRIIGEVKPKLAVIQHFGMTMLNAGPEKEAGRIEKETGVTTVAARDGMILDLDGLGEDRQLGLNSF